MKNRSKIYLIQLCTLLVCGAFASCSDWTDVEHLKMKEPPASGEAYLAELRQYRGGEHNVVIAWFENVEVPESRAHHLTVLPDSVDIISFTNPVGVPSWLQAEMRQVRADKGMKVIYTIDYPAIEREYKASLEEELPAGRADQGDDPGTGNNPGDGGAGDEGFLKFASDYMDRTLALCDGYGFDGLSVYYPSKRLDHMEEADKAVYLARQGLFISKTMSWIDSHPDKLFVFEGEPEFLQDKRILEKAGYIVLHTQEIMSKTDLTFSLTRVVEEGGVPADRFVVMVEPRPLKGDTSLGMFYDDSGDLSLALLEVPHWIRGAHKGFSVRGMGIRNIQNDYYKDEQAGKTLTYHYSRAAVSILNPSPKQ